MLPNLIIFTTGSSGSSVLAGVIARQGYWLGEATKQLTFDTFENSELVDLNITLLKKSGFRRRDCNDLPPPNIKSLREVSVTLDLEPFRKFLKKCEMHRPWLWKDPRLAFTIHFWAEIHDFTDAKIIFIRRDPRQSYGGLILSRKTPISYKEYTAINNNYENSFLEFVKSKNVNHVLTLTFEDLLLHPLVVLENINNYLGVNISIADLKAVYKGKLGRLRYSFLDYLNARVQYLVYRYILNDYVRFPHRKD